MTSIICATCNGSGQESSGNKDGDVITVKDCEGCKGIGYTVVKIVDKRVNSRYTPLEYPEKW